MKKAVKFILALTFILCLPAVACGPKDTGNSGKTLLKRAQELSQYYDSVPANLAELTGAEDALALIQEERGGKNLKVARAYAVNKTENQMYAPEERPRPLPPGIIATSCYYSQNSIETIIGFAKEEATSAKENFKEYPKLNVWYTYGQGGIRLNYNKQLDKISREWVCDYKSNRMFSYTTSQLYLGKNHKINFSSVSYVCSGENEIYGGHMCEYVEDDYYYYVHNSGTNGAMNSVIFIDLKTEPVNIYYAQSSDSNDYVEKHISLELNDGKRLSYVDFYGVHESYLYDANRDVMLAKRDNGVKIDLWQTDGWEWLEQTPWLDIYSIKTDKVMEVESGQHLYQDAERTIDLDISPYGNYEDRNVLVEVDINYADAQSNTYENLETSLEKIGLSVKNDFSDVYGQYFAKTFEEAVSDYSAKKFDYVAMGADAFKAQLAQIKSRENLPALRAEYENAEIFVSTGVDTSEAYVMLDSSMTGEAQVSFEDFKMDLSSVTFNMQDSVLLDAGHDYGVKVGLYNGNSFVELASAQTPYTNGDLTVSVANEISLIKDIEYGGNYILVAYFCDESGVRYSEFFYPDIANDGYAEKVEGNDKYTLTVKNKSLKIERFKAD